MIAMWNDSYAREIWISLLGKQLWMIIRRGCMGTGARVECTWPSPPIGLGDSGFGFRYRRQTPRSTIHLHLPPSDYIYEKRCSSFRLQVKQANAAQHHPPRPLHLVCIYRLPLRAPQANAAQCPPLQRQSVMLYVLCAMW